MNNLMTLCLSIAALLPVAAQEATPYERMLEVVAPSILPLEATLAVEINMRGQSQQDETVVPATGVVVDGNLIMLSANALNPTPDTPPGVSVSFSPVDIKVLIPGTDAELAATLVATDEKLGVSYLKVKDLGDVVLKPLDHSNSARGRIGEPIFAVNRLGKGFDYAPHCRSGVLTGKIKKPRRAHTYSLPGGGPSGTCIFNADGAFIGMLARVKAMTSSGGEDSRPFVVSVKAFRTALASAQEAAKAASKKKDAAEGQNSSDG